MTCRKSCFLICVVLFASSGLTAALDVEGGTSLPDTGSVLPAAAAVSNKCNSLTDAAQQQQCIVDWVNWLRGHEGLKACGSLACVNEWVNFKYLLSRCGVNVADCDCLGMLPPPGSNVTERIQKCINGWVLDRQQKWAAVICANKATVREQQQCLYAWADDKRVTEKDLPPGIMGASCFSLPPSYTDSCIATWVNTKICHQAGFTHPNCSASCSIKYTTAAARIQCVNEWIQGEQWLALLWEGPHLLPGKFCSRIEFNTSQAMLRRCYNSYIYNRAFVLDWDYLHNSEMGVDCNPGVYDNWLTNKALQLCVNKYLRHLTTQGGQYASLAGCNELEQGKRQQCYNAWVTAQHKLDTWWRYPVSARKASPLP